MPSIHLCEFLGDGWSEWKESHRLPPLPDWFEKNHCTITLSSQGDTELCYIYSPIAKKISWCVWDNGQWSEWEDALKLPPPPNYLIEGIEKETKAFFSISSHDDNEWLLSYNPADSSLFWSPWEIDKYGDWQGSLTLERPPNLGDSSDIFAGGDGTNEWLLSINSEEWSIFFSKFEDGTYNEWTEAPILPIPQDWIELGVDLDADGRDGQFWIYATVYDDKYYEIVK